MKQLKKALSFTLALALAISSVAPLGVSANTSLSTAEVKTEMLKYTSIEISTPSQLSQIGINPSYPLDGDYVLTADIDLGSLASWTPVGGSNVTLGAQSGSFVFSGTFDGQGHTISDLYANASLTNSQSAYGIFGVVGSNAKDDPAVITNLILDNCSIDISSYTGTLSAGILAGEVNGYAEISNISSISSDNSDMSYNTIYGKTGTLKGAGCMIGSVNGGKNGVTLRDLYNTSALYVESSGRTCLGGGIAGLISASSVESMSSCVYAGNYCYVGRFEGYGISSGAATNVTNCYYLTGAANTGVKKTEAEFTSGTLFAGLDSSRWSATSGSYLCLNVKSATKGITLPDPVFAGVESWDRVKSDFTLPLTTIYNGQEVPVTWTSGNSSILSINSSAVTVTRSLLNQTCTLTAAADGVTKTFNITVLGTAGLSFEKEYPKVGEAFPVIIGDGTLTGDFTYKWTINGTTVSTANSYTPVAQDLEKMLTVSVSMNGQALGSTSVYISNVMVAYIDTENSAAITSKETYMNGSFKLQGNSLYNSTNTTLYDGAMEIRGRGNTTWGLNKNPYKIKLDKSTDLLGFGKSKHWVLIANYMDESHMRNKLAYDLSQDMGMPSMQSTYVELVLNGEYVGLYQLCEQVRISTTRVNTFDWSKVSESVAKKIVAANSTTLTAEDQTAIEDQMNTEMSWMTSKILQYKGVSYNVADYYKDLPDATGGFLIELDQYWDENSKFKTSSGQPIQISEPEYLATDSEAFTYISDYIQDFEDSVRAYDFYSSSTNKSYSELADMDSIIKTWLINEIFFNTETCKKSFYMYKDIAEPLTFGPIWDMDWSANSDISSSETNYPTKWMTIERSASAQAESWYKYMIKDPYFALKAEEAYEEFRTRIQDLIASGKDIDQLYSYIQTAANANYALGTDGVRNTKKDFAGQVSTLRTFLTTRLAWLDAQFASVDTLYTSLQGSITNTLASKIALTVNGTATGTTATVTVNSMTNAAKAAFYVNGKKASTVALSANKATASISTEMLVDDTAKDNIVTVYILDSSDQPVSSTVPVTKTVTSPYGGSYQVTENVDVYATNYKTFTNATAPTPLTGSLILNGTAKAGNTLTAVLSSSNITGTPTYQWFADGQAISGATGTTYQVREEDLGKTLYVGLSSDIESGSVNSVSTKPVTAADTGYSDLIINQVYGGGNAGGNPVSHDFIEIYNPALSPVNLEGYKISYLSNRTGKAGSTGGQPVTLELTGTIPSHTSFLIRCKAETTTTSFRYTVSAFDQEWNQTIDNKQYSISLLKGTQFIDGVSVNEAPVEGPALAEGFISKQLTVRRNAFSDKDNNVTDFVAVSYSDISDENLAASRPRSLADGVWGLSTSSSDQPDPGNDDSELTDVQKFIQRLYSKVLSRTAEAEGMTYYNDLLVRGERTGAEVGQGFVFSTEFKERNLGNFEFIEVLYNTFMDRNSDEGGKAYWLNMLDNGVSREFVFKGFVESTEYAGICKNYGIVTGSCVLTEPRNQNASLTMFVNRLYAKALGRTAEVEGLDYYTKEINAGNLKPVQAAQNFIFSSEFKDKNLSDSEYVKVLYRTFMGREFDQDGLDYHLNSLNNKVSREEVLLGFANSPEFKAIMNNFGLK